MDRGNISKLTLQRLPTYLSYLKSRPAQGNDAVSAAAIAGALGLGEVQVRKDLAAVSSAGRPKVGYLVSELPRVCREKQVQIGILTVPAAAAQSCLDALVDGGVRAVWNFAPTHLNAPKGVLVQRENMASSLALLSYHLKQGQTQDDQD